MRNYKRRKIIGYVIRICAKSMNNLYNTQYSGG